MPRTSGEGAAEIPAGSEPEAMTRWSGCARWTGAVTVASFVVSAGLVAGVTAHSWGPDFARAPYRVPYSSATAPPTDQPRALPQAVPAPLAQAPPAQPDTPASPSAPENHGPGESPHRNARPALVNRPAVLLGLTPGTVAFEAQMTGTTAAARQVTVASTGNEPLHVRTVGLSGTDAAAFSVVADHCSGVTLNPGASCPVMVTFAPNGDGTHSANLVIAGDGAGPVSTQLSGVAVDAPITAQGIAVDCGQSTAGRCIVDTLYQQLLGRPADPSGLQNYAGQLDSGQATRSQVAGALMGTDEWRSHMATALFEALLHRAPDPGALGYYVGQLRSATVDDVVASIAASQEYFTRAGGTNDGFVGSLYRDLDRRPADAAGRAAWVDQLNRGASRTSVALGMRRTPEAEAVVVQQATKLLLGRTAKATERNDLGGAMSRGGPWQAMVGSLVDTQEYSDRVAPLGFSDVAVASFVDGDPKGTASQFTATVDWGDGSQPSDAVVKRSKGGFVVLGSHTYATHRTWTATIHIVDVGGSQTTATTTIVV